MAFGLNHMASNALCLQSEPASITTTSLITAPTPGGRAGYSTILPPSL
ncbi:hypothetical protein CPCC7001_1965 [Cyanobium sp. PCC 7001]|nr:hypothetical protein CPCC7001_1965 [Cyanobium sp. PCC 7001]